MIGRGEYEAATKYESVAAEFPKVESVKKRRAATWFPAR